MCLGVPICGYVHVSAGSCEGQKKALDSLEVQVVWGLNLGPLKEQQVILIPEATSACASSQHRNQSQDRYTFFPS